MFLDSYVMPHGDFSDYAAYVCLGSGFASIFKPNLWFTGLGPIKPFFDSGDTPQTLAVIQFTGSLLLVCSSTFNYLCRRRSYLAFLHSSWGLSFLSIAGTPSTERLLHSERSHQASPLRTSQWPKTTLFSFCVVCFVSSVVVHVSLILNHTSRAIGWYLFSVVFFFATLHLAFNANPMLTSAMLKEKEDKKAAEKAAKNK